MVTTTTTVRGAPAMPRPGSGGPRLARSAQEIHDLLARLDAPCVVVSEQGGAIAATDDPASLRAAGATVLAVAPPARPERLGAASFLTDYGVRQPYMTGAMANGIASPELVVAMARAGFLATYGAAGVLPDRIDDALGRIRRELGPAPFACNLIHSPNELELERAILAACLRHGVTCVEASAFLELTPQIVAYRAAGLRPGGAGGVHVGHRVVAKVSRGEVAELFLRPAPDALLRPLVADGTLTAEQAALARTVPMADDITVEADSGGHTDRRPLPVLLPEIIAVRDRIAAELGYRRPPRVGAAGGIGTPSAVFAAFALGAAYVVTGSVNQACVESGQSAAARALLAKAGPNDIDMAPASDMFEIGAEVQVLRRGTMFAGRGRRLYDLYRAHDSLDDLSAEDRDWLERSVLRRSVDEVWADTVDYFSRRDPEQIERAQANPKRRMALVFRWYLGLSSGWAISAAPDRITDYQIWCGPSLGAFNTWAAGSYLADVDRRSAVDVAGELMLGAAYTGRAAALRFAGVRLPARAAAYRPPATRESSPAHRYVLTAGAR
ncbi:PfaD family polyunsaturated fatty acid/polyketide biosynthesis protein [Frankia sp. KB5]|uniref:PfaD family polyunsaturated fatty acid/polyketide biosynthesis protein n=1 Tax=Frankia sp. KB5 TaxID=683318 RepID=UPI000A117D19|nr:PfaD family polyunsaturated fatty acid/polyketide biosynthesis protein [Frankia sp. KB5]ORT47212.1 2-nitropropane dioxygenase [Frankia sp. KB5]